MEQLEEGEPRRLTRTMSSRKLQAHDFIKRYFARWGKSPTTGELSAGLGVSKKRAHDLIHQLARDDMIEHQAGKTRGIRLVDRGEELSEADVLLRLSAMGWTIGRGRMVFLPPENAAGAAVVQGLTEKGLPRLDFAPDKAGSRAEVGPNGKADQARNGARSSTNDRGAPRDDQGSMGAAAS